VGRRKIAGKRHPQLKDGSGRLDGVDDGGAIHAFGHPILLRDVGNCKLMLDPAARKVRSEVIIQIFTAIVGSKYFELSASMCLGMFVQLFEVLEGFRLGALSVLDCPIGVIIYECDEVA
jgi:hypothetical protein